MNTAAPPGNCVTHGWHGMTTCPRCSSSAGPFTPLTQTVPARPVDQKCVDALDRLYVMADRAAGKDVRAADLAAITTISKELEQLREEREWWTAVNAELLPYQERAVAAEAENQRLREERDAALRGNWKREPSDEGGKGHEETYWLRNKLRSAVIHLRDIEDFYIVRGGAPESYNIQRARRARGIYEQISEDFLNGKLGTPTMRERAEAAEAEVQQLREAQSSLLAEKVRLTKGLWELHDTALALLRSLPIPPIPVEWARLKEARLRARALLAASPPDEGGAK